MMVLSTSVDIACCNIKPDGLNTLDSGTFHRLLLLVLIASLKYLTKVNIFTLHCSVIHVSFVIGTHDSYI